MNKFKLYNIDSQDHVSFNIGKFPGGEIRVKINGTKKSAKGLLQVEIVNGEYILLDDQTEAQEKLGELSIVFEDGTFHKEPTIAEIRSRLM